MKTIQPSGEPHVAPLPLAFYVVLYVVIWGGWALVAVGLLGTLLGL
jgi:hypothetical protein